MTLHLVKLCVGCDSPEDLLVWRRATFKPDDPWILRTRQTPRRLAELVDGGSLYRVYRGLILSRQLILGIDTIGEGPTRRCEVTLDPHVIGTTPAPRRAFQGWRYLQPNDAPPDLDQTANDETLARDFARRLRELGAW